MNEDTVLRSSNVNLGLPQSGSVRSVPMLPPRPSTGVSPYQNNYNSYTPVQSPYSAYGYNSYNSMPYRAMGYGSMGYNSYGTYNSYGMNGYNALPPVDDAERRFIQYAEERTRSAFASVESVVRTINSVSMMLDNTFFAMISSFRAILSVAESFGNMRNMFGQIWYSVSLYRLFKWLYGKFMSLFGLKIGNAAVNTAWNEVITNNNGATGGANGGGSNTWTALAFLGALMSIPYLISKFLLPKFEDRYNPEKWTSPGVRARVAFDFVASNSNEMSLRTNDEILLAPTSIQEEMKLTNTGWAFAVGNGKSGLVPLNYLVFVRKNNGVLKTSKDEVPVPRVFPKRVSFGENQIIETNTSEPVIAISQAQKNQNANNITSLNKAEDNVNKEQDNVNKEEEPSCT